MTNNQFRMESDTMGFVQVPADKYYGAQTERSKENFPICNDNPGHKMPKEVIRAMLYIKKAAALTNKELLAKYPDNVEFKKFSAEIADKIIDAVDIIYNTIIFVYR